MTGIRSFPSSALGNGIQFSDVGYWEKARRCYHNQREPHHTGLEAALLKLLVMDQAAKHENLADDAFAELFQRLQKIDAAKLSFVQLRRLQDQLMHASDAIEREVTIRAAEDASGDTVNVPPPTID